jgi:hypothetical protein
MTLAAFITSGRQADYETSFKLLKQAVGENLFGGQHYPKVFVTDDSLAEQNAISQHSQRVDPNFAYFM